MKMEMWLGLLTFFAKFMQISLGSEHLGGFVVVPESKTIHERSVAVFRCRHSDADDITWSVNGISVSVDAPGEINPGFERDRDSNLVDTLSITANSTNNNSHVVCKATIGSQSVSSPPALLTVLPRTSPLSGFTTAPESQNVAVGASVLFMCQHTDGDVVWRVNGQMVNELPDIMTTNERGLHKLHISNTHSIRNGSMIQCKAFFEGNSLEYESTEPAKLLLQGPLDSVSNLARNSSALSWTPPFSLDLTGVDPDIAYCVEVYNITCGRRDLIISDCNVTEPSYTLDEIAPDGYIYEYMVTPRSNVEGARNGRIKAINESFSQLIKSVTGQRVVFTGSNLLNVTVYLDRGLHSGNRSSVLPGSYAIMLTSLDGLDNTKRFITTTKNSEGTITLLLSSLPFRRVWNATFLAYGCAQHSLIDNGIEIGTHDIYSTSIVSLSGVITVTGDIIGGAMSRGILIIVYSLTNETNTHYKSTTFLPDQLRVNTMLMGLPAGQYQVSLFVVEESGLPFSRAAATPKSVQVDAQGQSGSPMIEHRIFMPDSSSTTVCINCTFLDSSTTHCVIVVHQRISQLNTSGLMNIESSHVLNRTGNTAYGCIEGINMTNYQVGVFGIRLEEKEIDGSRTDLAFIAGIIVAVIVIVLVVVTVIVILVILIYRAYSNRKVKPSNETNDTVYARTVHFGSRHEEPKEKEAENDYVMEYDTLQVSRIQEVRTVSEYDVAQPERSECTQEEREVNEYDVVQQDVDVIQRDESESTNEETEQYDDIIQERDKSKQYAEVGATPSPRLMVKLDDDKVIYSDIQDVQSPPVEQESQKDADNAIVRSSVNGNTSSGADHDDMEPTMALTNETVSAFSSYQGPTELSELVALVDCETSVPTFNKVPYGVIDKSSFSTRHRKLTRKYRTHNELEDNKFPTCTGTGEVKVSYCTSKVWQHKHLSLPGFKTATHQFQHIGQTMQVHHRKKTGQQ